MSVRLWLGLLWMIWVTGSKADVYSDRFSAEFRAQIDHAMEAQTGEERSRRRIQAIRDGADSEVLFVFPLPFSAEILNAPNEANLCQSEVAASLGNLQGYVESSGEEQANYAGTHATKIRADTERTVKCICQYYKGGQLQIPAGRSNSVLYPDAPGLSRTLHAQRPRQPAVRG